MAKFIAVLAVIITFALGEPIGFRINSNFNWRVVGGLEATSGQFPHQISLRYFGSHNCGGSILNSKWILTAAHCVAGISPSFLTVVVGSNSLRSGGSRYGVSKIIYHDAYDSLLIQNDVAVVQLSAELTFSNTVQPVQLETDDVGVVDCVVSGWGLTSYPGGVPDRLQYIDLKTIYQSNCRSLWSALNPVIASHVCTFTKSGEGVCKGDSGGPLVANEKQIGIVSFGMPCARGFPDVFTRVSSFYGWIQNAIQNEL